MKNKTLVLLLAVITMLSSCYKCPDLWQKINAQQFRIDSDIKTIEKCELQMLECKEEIRKKDSVIADYQQRYSFNRNPTRIYGMDMEVDPIPYASMMDWTN